MALIAACGALALPAAAGAAAWEPAQLGGLPGKSFLLSVSCPSRSLCVAGGTNNLIASSTNPTAGAWNSAYVGEGPWPNSDTWPNREISGLQIQSVSCPSTRMCVGVMNKGFVYSSTNPAGPGSAWKSVEIDDPGGRNTHLVAVSCPSADFCVAVAERRVGGGSGGDVSSNFGKVLVSNDPTGNADAWRAYELTEPFDFVGISCPRADLCVAVGADGRIAVTNEPRGSGSDWRILGAPAGPRSLQAITCVSTLFCLAGNRGGELLSTTSPSGNAWKAVGGGGTVQITAASCPSASECLAVDNNGSAITSTDPTGGSSAWHYLNIVPYEPPQEGSFLEGNGLFGAACPSRVLCVLTGARGQIFTNTDPFAEPPKPAKKKRKRARRGPKRPRARIATVKLPFPHSVIDRKAKVHIRFFARGRIRGYVCKFDRARFRRCHSPKGYKVGYGRHVFKVRAVGLTGLRGRADTAVIKIRKPCLLSSPLAARPKLCGVEADY
jgi:hypothetical protein